VGDAGYFKDPLTAHGITDAFRDAELLARAVGVGTPQALADYQQIRDGLSRRFFEISDLVGSFAWDLDLLKGLHLTMNEDMKREVDFLLALDDGFVKAA
jgi:flavin-dependent dehydrogenase